MIRKEEEIEDIWDVDLGKSEGITRKNRVRRIEAEHW